jgi:hypothetical protein
VSKTFSTRCPFLFQEFEIELGIVEDLRDGGVGQNAFERPHRDALAQRHQHVEFTVRKLDRVELPVLGRKPGRFRVAAEHARPGQAIAGEGHLAFRACDEDIHGFRL